jgi:hypothetical protein
MKTIRKIGAREDADKILSLKRILQRRQRTLNLLIKIAIKYLK